jgi:hypothetical protein
MKKKGTFKSGMTLAVALCLFSNTTAYAVGSLDYSNKSKVVVVNEQNQEMVQNLFDEYQYYMDG